MLPRRHFYWNVAWAVVLCFVVLLVCATSTDANSRPEVRYPSLAICKVFGSRCHVALRVAYCESRLDPYAVSRTRDVGLFQANYVAHRKRGESFASFKRRMVDVQRNVAFAYRLSRGGTNWGAWRWSSHCWGRS